MEILTADRRKQLRLLGEIDGLRRARVLVCKADYMSRSAIASCSTLIAEEIDKRIHDLDIIEARASSRKSG